MTRSGETRVIMDSLGGREIGKVNFVLRDRKDRMWVTVSTMVNPWSDAINSTLADGKVILVDEREPRVVADGFRFTNEIRFDADLPPTQVRSGAPMLHRGGQDRHKAHAISNPTSKSGDGLVTPQEMPDAEHLFSQQECRSRRCYKQSLASIGTLPHTNSGAYILLTGQ